MWSALFPGQGSQHVGMGKFLFENFNEAKETFEEASDSLSLDFKKLCFDGPESELALTHNTQPALLLVSTATFKVVTNNTPINSFTVGAGHSVGEYAAMVTSGAINFSDGMKAVRKRGEFMQSAVPIGKGGMLATMGLSKEQVEELCQWAQTESGLSPIEPANDNAPGQIVISGSQELIEWVIANASKDIFKNPPKRLKLIPLKVSAPFHCSMMKPAEDNMRPVLSDIPFHEPIFPIVQNVTAEAVTEPDSLRKNLIKQITAPVRWVETVSSLPSQGVKYCIEMGCGKVLSGLVKKIDSENLKTFNINSLEDIKALEDV